MAVNTVLLDFSVDPTQVKNDQQLSVISTNIENVLRDYLPNLKLINTINLDDGLFKLYMNEFNSLIHLRIYNNGLITVNLEYFKGDDQEPIITFECSKKLEQTIVAKIDSKWSQAFPPLLRCKFNRYYPSSDDRLFEYDIDCTVFETRSSYQKVQIVHSRTLGNMLILDDLQNISEADLIYTETLMSRGKENYENKEIVILGGGDGALLYELLKEKPKEVIMLEIDEIVMKACSKYMRSICGDVLDKMSGKNYQIIVGDCMKTLNQYIKDGRKFDYVFGDLTDIPISDDETNNSAELWDFVNQVLEMSFKILKPNGKFMTHIIGSASTDALKMYEKQLMKLKPAVKFTKTSAFVPSFLEDWVFCQVSFADQ